MNIVARGLQEIVINIMRTGLNVCLPLKHKKTVVNIVNDNSKCSFPSEKN